MKHSRSIISLEIKDPISDYKKKYKMMSLGFFREHMRYCTNFNRQVKPRNWASFKRQPLIALRDISQLILIESKAHLKLYDFFTKQNDKKVTENINKGKDIKSAAHQRALLNDKKENCETEIDDLESQSIK